MKELEKLEKIKDEAEPISEFLCWIQENKKYALCKGQEVPESSGLRNYMNTQWSKMFDLQIEKVMYEYFDIDYDKAERERTDILQELRKK